MSKRVFQEFESAKWRETRDTLQVYTKLLGKIKQSFVPPQKHFWHYGLYPNLNGISTQPMVAGDYVISLILHLQDHQMKLTRSDGIEQLFPLENQSANSLCQSVLKTLNKWGVKATIDSSLFKSEAILPYTSKQVELFWQATCRLSVLLSSLRSEMVEETSPIQIFPHHFDVSLTWFSGRNVPGVGIKDLDSLKEQMNFGLSFGDDTIPEAYLYVTAYPNPKQWGAGKLIGGASWNTKGWTGPILPYSALLTSDKPDKLVLNFYRTAWQLARKSMTSSIN